MENGKHFNLKPKFIPLNSFCILKFISTTKRMRKVFSNFHSKLWKFVDLENWRRDLLLNKIDKKWFWRLKEKLFIRFLLKFDKIIIEEMT